MAAEELNNEMNEIKNKYKLVKVTWIDIFAFSRLSLEEIEKDIEEYELYKSEVGYLVKETNDYIVIVHDLDLTGGSDNYGSYIPRGNVIEIEYLESTDEDEDQTTDQQVDFGQELKVSSSDARKYLKKVSEIINIDHQHAENDIDEEKPFINQIDELIDMINNEELDNAIEILNLLIAKAEQKYDALDEMMSDKLKHMLTIIEDPGQYFFLHKDVCINVLKQIKQTVMNNKQVEYDKGILSGLKDFYHWFSKEDDYVKQKKDKYFDERN